MKMDRTRLCTAICKLVGMARYNPDRQHLAKRELMQVYACLNADQVKITELESQLREFRVSTGRLGSHSHDPLSDD